MKPEADIHVLQHLLFFALARLEHEVLSGAAILSTNGGGGGVTFIFETTQMVLSQNRGTPI